MIFGARLTITGKLKTDSDLHIGGSNKEFVTEDGKQREVAALARWHDGKPFIPASSLKGVLRAALKQAGEDEKAVFGEGSEHERDKGYAARLWLDHAVLETEGAPPSNLSNDTSAPGAFHARHVALDAATGAAMDHKLFTREMVAAGATFGFSATWFGDADKLDTLAPLFAILRDGIVVGAGTSKGNGRASLDPAKITLTRHAPDADGAIVATQHSATALCEAIEALGGAGVACRRITLRLAAEGPFLSVRKIGGTDSNNQMLPLRRDDKPLIWTTSLAGALRARARWIVARNATDADHRDDPDRKRRPEELRNQSNLGAIEDLFGVAGRRAKLTVKSVTCENPGNQVKLTSNSIDRLTGATRNQALFTRIAQWQPEFRAELEVAGKDEPALLRQLLDDLKNDPLELGHGASIGFGWFKVEEIDGDG